MALGANTLGRQQLAAVDEQAVAHLRGPDHRDGRGHPGLVRALDGPDLLHLGRGLDRAPPLHRALVDQDAAVGLEAAGERDRERRRHEHVALHQPGDRLRHRGPAL